MPEIPTDRVHVFHLYVILCPKNTRDKLALFLNKKGIATGIHYPIPIHLQQSFKYLGKGIKDFPLAEEYANNMLSLPMYPELEEEAIRYISKNIRKFFND